MTALRARKESAQTCAKVEQLLTQVREANERLLVAAVHAQNESDTLPPPTLGVGIRGMRERIRQLGGTFDVEFSDKGTTVRVRVPLNEDVA